MQRTHGVRSGEPIARAQRSQHRRRPVPSLAGHRSLRDAAAVSEAHPLPFRRTIRRQELRQIVPLAETTIYEVERCGEFPRRFNLMPRCVVWDLAEVEAWIEERKQAPCLGFSKPDVHL